MCTKLTVMWVWMYNVHVHIQYSNIASVFCLTVDNNNKSNKLLYKCNLPVCVISKIVTLIYTLIYTRKPQHVYDNLFSFAIK